MTATDVSGPAPTTVDTAAPAAQTADAQEAARTGGPVGDAQSSQVVSFCLGDEESTLSAAREPLLTPPRATLPADLPTRGAQPRRNRPDEAVMLPGALQQAFDAAAAPEAREMAAAFAAGVGRRATAENARKAAKKAALELARALG